MAVKASVRSASSIGTAKVETAKEKAANSPPMAVPTTSMPQPSGVVVSICATWLRPGNGLKPKNSA